MTTPLKVVVAGGGVAALETTLALRALAQERVAVTLVAPQPDFVYRPMTVREPFAAASADRRDLAEMVADMGADLVVDRLARVDATGRVAHTAEGEPLPYDALVLAMGARRSESFPHGTTIDDRHLDDQLHGLVQDIEGGYVHSVAFVIPTRMAWPLPIYELALMTASRAFEMGVEVMLTVVTPEPTPLAVFGDGASLGVSELLADAGIAVETAADASVPSPGHVVIYPGTRRVDVDRVVALPELTGPALRGLPVAEHGFLGVDSYCRVRGVDRIYAAGDAANFPIKHGGLAALQADTVALGIASLAGAAVQPVPYRPEIRGMLLTGGKPLFLSATLVAGRGFASEITDSPSWSPPAKIAAKYLAPYLEEHAAHAVRARS